MTNENSKDSKDCSCCGKEQCKPEPTLVQDYFGDWEICKHCYKPWSESMHQEYKKQKALD